jgi:hypothetical protein
MPRRTGERVVTAAVALALLVTAPAAASAATAEPVSLEARLDRDTIAADESVTLEIRLESPEAPSALDLAGDSPFQIVSRTEARQSSFTLGGGGVQARQVFVTTLGLAPSRAGDLILPPVRAVVAGKTYQTRPLSVKVLPAGAARPPPAQQPLDRGGTPFRGWERDLVLDVQVDRREAWLGEQVTLSIWLLSPLGVIQAERFDPPRHEGFWMEELETPRTLQQQIRDVNGVPTRAYLLQRVALFPTRAGALKIGAAEIAVSVRVGGGTLFDPFPTAKRVTRRSAPIPIQVKPLPPGAPAGFEAVNVGQLGMTATASDARVAAGQPVTVRVTASGEGNVRALALPRLPAVAGARGFEPTVSESVAPRGSRLAGSRTIETVLVPDRTGELVVPSLEWSWFDPAAGRYQTARTAELRVAVDAGAPGAAAAAPGTNALAAGLRPIREDGALARRGGPPWRSPLFAALLAVGPLGFAALALADRLRTRAATGEARRRRAGQAAARLLKRARRDAAKGDRAAVLAEVERALLGYASDRLGRPAAGLTRDALGAVLGHAGAHPPAVRALASALDACDLARFGGGGAPDAAVIDAAERALGLLEEADWTPPGGGEPGGKRVLP